MVSVALTSARFHAVNAGKQLRQKKEEITISVGDRTAPDVGSRTFLNTAHKDTQKVSNNQSACLIINVFSHTIYNKHYFRITVI